MDKMKILINIVKCILNFMYWTFKQLPTQKKVLFCSRQTNDISIDYKLIEKEIEKRKLNVKRVFLCKRFSGYKDGVVSFGIVLLKSLYHLATSQVCVLDGYWPSACMLNHKEDLTIIQIWHSIGKIKKSGYQTLDTKYGRKSQSAELLCMHKNYDYIIAGGEAWNDYYCKSFNVDGKEIRNYGLPRIDDFILRKEEYAKKVVSIYPEFKEKTVILYAPTFRKYDHIKWNELYKHFAGDERYVFICKMHPNQKENVEGPYTCREFSTLELISVSDYVITDYSSIALEAAIMDKKIFYYLYDYEQYVAKNGLNIDIRSMMPTYTFEDAETLYKQLTSANYDFAELKKYKEKFLPRELGKATQNIVNLIEENLCLNS